MAQAQAQGKLGFGFMRLPLTSGKQEDIDQEQVNQMVDLFLERGFTYLDTSYVYHAGKSEGALGKAAVQRHPRDSFTIATKFPTFAVQAEDQVDGFLDEQLGRLGTDYVDYYLLHTVNRKFYDGIDGQGGVVKTFHLFDHMKKWKEEGKIRNIGFSFHDSADVLDRILDEHPEVDFVQIVLNYYDWESEAIQSKRCYETIRKHGKRVVIMEPVKGGTLANLPTDDAEKLRTLRPDWSQAAWALHFAQGHEGVLAVLSGMSTLAQVDDNTTSMQDGSPLSNEEEELLLSIARDIKAHGPEGAADFSKYAGVSYHGVPVSWIFDTYNAILAQPDPSFSAEMNYLPPKLLATGVADVHQEFPEETVVFEGQDISPRVKKAWDFLVKTAIAL